MCLAVHPTHCMRQCCQQSTRRCLFSGRPALARRCFRPAFFFFYCGTSSSSHVLCFTPRRSAIATNVEDMAPGQDCVVVLDTDGRVLCLDTAVDAGLCTAPRGATPLDSGVDMLSAASQHVYALSEDIACLVSAGPGRTDDKGVRPQHLSHTFFPAPVGRETKGHQHCSAVHSSGQCQRCVKSDPVSLLCVSTMANTLFRSLSGSRSFSPWPGHAMCCPGRKALGHSLATHLSGVPSASPRIPDTGSHSIPPLASAWPLRAAKRALSPQAAEHPSGKRPGLGCQGRHSTVSPRTPVCRSPLSSSPSPLYFVSHSAARPVERQGIPQSRLSACLKTRGVPAAAAAAALPCTKRCSPSLRRAPARGSCPCSPACSLCTAL